SSSNTTVLQSTPTTSSSNTTVLQSTPTTSSSHTTVLRATPTTSRSNTTVPQSTPTTTSSNTTVPQSTPAIFSSHTSVSQSISITESSNNAVPYSTPTTESSDINVLRSTTTSSNWLVTSLQKSTTQLPYTPSSEHANHISTLSSLKYLATSNVHMVIPSKTPEHSNDYTPEYSEKRFDGKAIFALEFTKALLDPRSKAFVNMRLKFQISLHKIYKNEAGFKHVTVERFSNGSVIVHYSLFFDKTSNVTEISLYQTLVKANGTALLEGLPLKGGRISFVRPPMKDVFPSWAIVVICIVSVIAVILAVSFIKWKHHRSKRPQSISKKEQKLLNNIQLEMFSRMDSTQRLRAQVGN
ncbi:mucin-1-like, partial [Actinia tenebrosa]|uniref:Mucin-1-like n=1 Tax=Actinia tenebrosa TaxID=6105 RepID=A0A6P8HQD5_ACTTE